MKQSNNFHHHKTTPPADPMTGGASTKPWGPALDLYYFLLTHTLKIAMLMGFAGFLNAVLSFQAACSLGLLLTAIGAFIRLGYHRVREKGVVNYLPQSMQTMLLET